MDKTPLKIVPNVVKIHDASSPSISFDKNSGWITMQSPKSAADQQTTTLCFLPAELRGLCFAIHNERTIVIASDSTHQLTIIDLGPMLDMLRKLGVI
jgi:hypothetical protein